METRKYDIAEVLPFVLVSNHIVKKEFNSQFINITSQRLQLFKNKGTTCIKCGIKGTFFRLTKAINNNIISYHFNLYALNKNNQEVLMTKDHIIPKSKGGKNYLSNYQVMCVRCNEAKANNIKL